MGLLGGAPESGGKVSKLAALAAARKKKEGEKTPAEATPTVATPSADKTPEAPAAEAKHSPLSLRERLAANDKPQKQSNGISTFRSLGKGSAAPSPPLKKPTPEPTKPEVPTGRGPEVPAENGHPDHKEKEEPEVDIRAPPSGFASTIVGDSTRPMMTEPSHLYSNTADLLRIYGQDLTEPFDFAGPSPDDVVVNAQSSAKGLAIRRKI